MSTNDVTLPEAVDIFDTTLRDGSQLEGISLTVDDKLRIAEQLDHLGVHYIEGGYPGANPKDDEFFQRAQSELDLKSSTMVAFGSTRRVKGKVDEDLTLQQLVRSEEHTSELQSLTNLVCRLLLEKKKRQPLCASQLRYS